MLHELPHDSRMLSAEGVCGNTVAVSGGLLWVLAIPTKFSTKNTVKRGRVPDPQRVASMGDLAQREHRLWRPATSLKFLPPKKTFQLIYEAPWV